MLTGRRLAISVVAALALVAVVAGSAMAAPWHQTPVAPVQQQWQGYGPCGGGFGMGHGHGWGFGMRGGFGAFGGMLGYAADALGLSAEELAIELQAGKTLAQVAAERGIAREGVVNSLLASQQEALAARVAAGYLTQEQADAMLAQMRAHADWMLDQTHAGYGPCWNAPTQNQNQSQAPAPRGFGRGGMMRGFGHW